MGGWRGDRGSYVVSPTPPVSPLGKGRAQGGEGGGGGGAEGPKGQGQGAGMGAFRVERGSKSRGSRLRIRSPFRKKEKEEVRRSFILAFEEQPPEKILREAEGGLVLNEEYTEMIEKKEKQLLNEAEEVETVEVVSRRKIEEVTVKVTRNANAACTVAEDGAALVEHAAVIVRFLPAVGVVPVVGFVVVHLEC